MLLSELDTYGLSIATLPVASGLPPKSDPVPEQTEAPWLIVWRGFDMLCRHQLAKVSAAEQHEGIPLGGFGWSPLSQSVLVLSV